jgi:hypothetical protein
LILIVFFGGPKDMELAHGMNPNKLLGWSKGLGIGPWHGPQHSWGGSKDFELAHDINPNHDSEWELNNIGLNFEPIN